MRKLLLTSAGFENPKIRLKFLELVGKDPEEIKVLFIPTAAQTKEEKYYANESKKEILELGIKDIIEYNLEGETPKEFDAIYVCGGNTFYLLDKVRKSGFDKRVIEFIDKGKVYVGVSAGSIIMGPLIGIAAPFDQNQIGLKDLTGLKLIDSVITPHYTPEEKKIIDKFEGEHPIIRLTDQQAVLVIGEKEKVLE